MIYHEINKACLGVSLRRFQQWFQQYDEDLRKLSEQAEAKERTLSEQSSLAGSEDSFYSKAKEEIVISKKKQAKRKLRANEAASPKRIKPNPKPELRVLKKLVSRAIPSNQAPKKRPRASIEPPGPSPGVPPSKVSRPKPSSILYRRYKFERGPTVFYQQ